ncbi:MAG: leucyl aminopeptidase [Verrucomicrobia bacterium]|nr:leucyl aminopeptidase [Verrucomicrobiota bacterium]
MKLQLVTSQPKSPQPLVRFFARGQRSQLPVAVSERTFALSTGSLLHLHESGTLCVGLGDGSTADHFRRAAASATKALRRQGHDACTFDVRGLQEHLGPLVEGALLGSYRFEDFKTADKSTPALASLTLLVPATDARTKAAAQRGLALGQAANRARQIANQPPNVFYPQTLAETAAAIARERKLKLTVLDEKALRKGKFGGLLAVGGGSARPPRLVVLRYDGGRKGEAPIALVGKAVTFDSGGISIKPALGMEEMVWDKCGGCAVLGMMAGVAALGLKQNVVGIIPAAENLLDGLSYRPGDIVTVYDGKHIEINNTDAEGRVILADALGYAVKDVKARQIIDLATLTGAAVVALGDHVAGLWSNHSELRAGLQEAAEKAGEKVWHMPLFPEYEEQIRSQIALIKNSSGRPGGANTAATFLKTFVGDTPWAHLDIAGPAAADKEMAFFARGATGFGVRTVLEYLAGLDD